MGYIIGVSSGMFGMAQPQEKIGMIDLAQKGFYSAFKGVNFTQIDLETASEFISPNVQEKLRRLRNEMNVNYGIHGLSAAMGARGIFLDSALKDDWQRTQSALYRDIDNSGEVGARYYLQHASETSPYGWLGKDMQPSNVVDAWGRPLHIFLEENPSVLYWLIEQSEIRGMRVHGTVNEVIDSGLLRGQLEKIAGQEAITEMFKEGLIKTREDLDKDPEKYKEFAKRVEKKVGEKMRPAAQEHVKEELFSSLRRSELVYGAERVAYVAMAKWMSDKNDPLWEGIVGKKKIDDVKDDFDTWVPAVSLKYIYGHFFPEEVKGEDKYKDPKVPINKHKIYFVIETETMKAGSEDSPRVANPKHFVVLCREMEKKGLSYFKAAIDFEHCLGAFLKPMGDKEGETGFLQEMGRDGGKYVGVLHVGWPTPIGPAHVPIYLGSEEQENLYKWMFELRKNGFSENEDRFIIFERAGGVGGDPVDQSTMALKKIVEFLRMDVRPDDLTKEENLHFYGIDDSSLKMQQTEIIDHMMDPIKGLLQIPEEQHGFIGGSAVQKGKAKEWEAGKMR